MTGWCSHPMPFTSLGAMLLLRWEFVPSFHIAANVLPRPERLRLAVFTRTSLACARRCLSPIPRLGLLSWLTCARLPSQGDGATRELMRSSPAFRWHFGKIPPDRYGTLLQHF